jgi:hypothetical protein
LDHLVHLLLHFDVAEHPGHELLHRFGRLLLLSERERHGARAQLLRQHGLVDREERLLDVLGLDDRAHEDAFQVEPRGHAVRVDARDDKVLVLLLRDDDVVVVRMTDVVVEQVVYDVLRHLRHGPLDPSGFDDDDDALGIVEELLHGVLGVLARLGLDDREGAHVLHACRAVVVVDCVRARAEEQRRHVTRLDVRDDKVRPEPRLCHLDRLLLEGGRGGGVEELLGAQVEGLVLLPVALDGVSVVPELFPSWHLSLSFLSNKKVTMSTSFGIRGEKNKLPLPHIRHMTFS